DLAALVIGQERGDDRGVAHIFGLIFRQVVEHDVGESLVLFAGQQSREDRVAVETRITPPDDPRTRIDQGSRPSIADDGKIQPMVFHPTASPRVDAIWSNQARTSSGLLKWPSTPATVRPTENPKPPSCAMTGKTGSSVTSSPMKIGYRLWNGGNFISSATANALLTRAGLTSTTALPGKISTVPGGNWSQMATTAACSAGPRSGASR